MREGEGQANQLYFKKPVKKTLRKEHAWLQFQNKLFQENNCFYRFLTDVARISLFQGFVVKKIIGDAIRPGRILIERALNCLTGTRKGRLSSSERHRVSSLSLTLQLTVWLYYL